MNQFAVAKSGSSENAKLRTTVAKELCSQPIESLTMFNDCGLNDLSNSRMLSYSHTHTPLEESRLGSTSLRSGPGYGGRTTMLLADVLVQRHHELIEWGDVLIDFSLRVLWMKGNGRSWAADGPADGNIDHADSKPLGFQMRSALGYGASWDFVGDIEPLGERQTVVAAMDIWKTQSLSFESEDLIVTFFSDEVAHGGGVVEWMVLPILFCVCVVDPHVVSPSVIKVLVPLNLCLCGVYSGLCAMGDWISTD
ncbi:hypothetical protein TIFTF001_034717 [Ficus carica]|uniref:Uncharacterized protein n=1 Tax=Ficus carica TaxID=3494 RepID=A0AA88E0X8_FICCA|nr:hypothetical protein TIFTF001_034717 [Ficus carica]